jgi:hypothetical protein
MLIVPELQLSMHFMDYSLYFSSEREIIRYAGRQGSRLRLQFSDVLHYEDGQPNFQSSCVRKDYRHKLHSHCLGE